MQTVYHLRGNEPAIARIVAATFPGRWTGKLYRLIVTDASIDARGMTGPGSVNAIKFIDLATLEATQRIPLWGVRPDAPKNVHRVTLPPGIAAVEWGHENGRSTGIAIYIRPEDMREEYKPRLCADLTTEERIVLNYTARYTRSMFGRSQYRLYAANRDTGITAERWKAAQISLWQRGLLTRIGKITGLGLNELRETKL
jgi:hypothetical protein